jgi:hypothetical protein
MKKYQVAIGGNKNTSINKSKPIYEVEVNQANEYSDVAVLILLMKAYENIIY